MRISDTARRGFDRLATQHGVTLTALLEALGQRIEAHPDTIPAEVIEQARVIDFERRSRR